MIQLSDNQIPEQYLRPIMAFRERIVADAGRLMSVAREVDANATGYGIDDGTTRVMITDSPANDEEQDSAAKAIDHVLELLTKYQALGENPVHLLIEALHLRLPYALIKVIEDDLATTLEAINASDES